VKYDASYEACQICESRRIKLIKTDYRENQIYECEGCSVQFMNPVYSDEYLQKYYADFYDAEGAGPEIIKAQQSDNEAKFQFLDKFIKAPGKVLDFGCGNGNFSSYAKSKGWSVVGYDIDAAATQKVSDKLGIKVESGLLEKVDWNATTFDLIHAHHVVEHLKDPVQDLKILRGLLADDGFLYVAVPNINSLSIRVKFFLEKIGLRRNNIGKYYDSDHHVFYYSPKSLKRMLEKCGFEVVFSINAPKKAVGNSKIAEFFTYHLPNFLYSNGAFFVIATKK